MIKERYCSFEVAKLLKEKGFRCYCASAYMTDGDVRELLENTVEWNNGLINWNSVSHDDLCYWGIAGWNVECSRPTHQMAMDWLREGGFHVNAVISYDYSVDADGNEVDRWTFWLFEISSSFSGNLIYTEEIDEYDSYEEAVEAALKYCLTKLI